MIKTFLITFLLLSVTLQASNTKLLFENSDFERGDLHNWTASGEAFEHQPIKGDNIAARFRGSSKMQGQHWVGTYEKYDGKNGFKGGVRGDLPMGTLTSIPFTIQSNFLCFRIGGGNDRRYLGVFLLVDGKEVFLAVGNNEEKMSLKSANVARFKGKEAKVLIRDNHNGGWGHINVDDFRASHIAINYSPDGEFNNYTTYLATNYNQSSRPQFHFTSRMNWLSNPCGLVYHEGMYHLFFQHNPEGLMWGNCAWGHATSPDLIKWTQKAHALTPVKNTFIYPGSSVVDIHNHSGLQKGNTAPLLNFTTLGLTPSIQSLAYSTDQGKSFQWHQKMNAIVPNQGFDPSERGPKVFWHAPSKAWVMVLWMRKGTPGRCRFFRSTNLKEWEIASDYEGDWFNEALGLIELEVEDHPKETKWILYDASFHYQVGEFDGHSFQTKGETERNEYGISYYAPQTLKTPHNSRQVAIAWLKGSEFRELYMPFNQQLSFPCRLSLRKSAQGYRLLRSPIAEISKLYDHSLSFQNISVQGLNEKLKNKNFELIDLSLSFAAADMEISLRGNTIRYNKETHSLICKQARIPAQERNGYVDLRILLDRASMEIFVNKGEATSSSFILSDPSKQAISFQGTGTIKDCSIHSLKSIWADQ
ncbi:MAG: glycoside hydrolase family 32 protein [Planctomycetes bacterium]|nr:glycoside hydrolase family 32 protein [Planctomycetota bacterium]